MTIWHGSGAGVFTVADIASGRIAPPPPLFNDFMLDNTLVEISAPPYTGKSLLVASMIASLDTGRPLFGKYYPRESKKVLAFLQDAPTWDYAEQIRKILRGYDIEDHERDMMEAVLVVNRGVQVTDPKFVKALREYHKEHGFDVVFLDAFWTMHGMNENNNSEMAYVMGVLKDMREEFGCVIFTHHDKKLTGTERAGMNSNYVSRGATNIPIAVDFHLHLTRTGDRVRIELPKGRGMRESLTYYDIKEIDHPKGEALALVAPKAGAVRTDFVLMLLAEPKQRKELIEAMKKEYNMTTARATKAVDNDIQLLRTHRKIEKAGHGIWKRKGD